jgi:hypothetical protein
MPGPEPTLKLSTGAAARPVKTVVHFKPFPVVIRGYGRIKSDCSLLLKKYRGRPIKDVISCVEVLKSFNDFATELVTKRHNALLPRFANFSKGFRERTEMVILFRNQRGADDQSKG